MKRLKECVHIMYYDNIHRYAGVFELCKNKHEIL